MRVRRSCLMLIGWSALALAGTGCGSTPDPTGSSPNAVFELACSMAQPGLHAEFQSGGPTMQGPFSASITKLNLPPSPQLISLETESSTLRKFFFILPSLAPGKYPLGGTVYVSYTEAQSGANNVKAWQATNGYVEIGTCTNGAGNWIYVDDINGWPPAQSSLASGDADPGRVYGLLP